MFNKEINMNFIAHKILLKNNFILINNYIEIIWKQNFQKTFKY